jgi:immunity protein, SdpI family
MNPINPSLKTEIIPLLLIVLTMFLSVYFYDNWPDTIASHWNFKGEVDGYSNKIFMVWLFPFMMSLLYALFLALPYIDPKKKNYKGFSSFYHFFKILIMSVLFLTFLGVGLFNLNYNINITLLTTVSIGSFMIIIGSFLKDIKPNWFMGIKNPWTLSSDKVWKKTHILGGYFFMIFGVIIIACNFLPEILSIILFIIGMLLIIIGTTIYSFFIYSKEKKKN